MKNVIFIVSTAFSGSTMLDLMLANTESGFSCGEVGALFRPWRKHHINPLCGCGDPNCGIWQSVKLEGEKELYSGLFNRFPQLEYIIDSTKDLSWIRDQIMYSKGAPYQVSCVLLWKEPLAYALSCWKRGISSGWENRWVNYYNTFYSFAEDWISVPFSELALNPTVTLKILCSKLGISYHDEQELFWNGRFHTLFGSDSVKAHIVDDNSKNFIELTKTIKEAKPNVEKDAISELVNRRTFYYDKDYLEKVPNEIRYSAKNDKEMEKVLSVLDWTDFRRSFRGQLNFIPKKLHKPAFWYLKEKIRFKFLGLWFERKHF